MYINAITWFFGFISGFLLLITGNTLNFWISKDGCSLELIGLFSLVSIPYAINFLWAPILDRYKLEFIKVNLNFRVKWILILHILGISTLAILSLYDPSEHSKIIAILAFLLAFINSTSDLALNALRTEINQKTTSDNSGFYIFGYRSGMVVSGSLAILVSQYISWQKIYLIFAIIYSTFPIIIFILQISKIKFLEPQNKNSEKDQASLKTIISSIGNIKIVGLILLFLALYRIADNFIGVMLNPFLIYHGFSESEIAIAGKFCGIIGAGLGGLLSTKILSHYKISECLFLFAIIHAISHGSYILIAQFGNVTKLLIFATLAESITGGMTMAAYISLITKLCNGKYRATQYALFSAMMGASRTILPSLSGFIVLNSNWTIFFIFSIIMVSPSLFLLKKLKPVFIEKNL